MKCFVSFVICLALALPALAQTAATQPLGGSTNPLLGKLFRSRIDGIQFNPPAGGGMIRELNSGDIVRFVYADDNWDVRVKPVQLHVPLALSAPPDAGLLELTASHLTDSNPSAVILRKEVMAIHGNNVGRIEATYNAGTDRIFAQQALFKDFKDTGERYFSVQMTSKDPAKDDARARTAFEAMLDSVQILDRQELAKEQERRLLKTRGLWVLLDRKTISAALQPLHFMRVVRDGRDVGFIQINERLAKHNGNDGVEVIIHSRVQPDQQTDTSSPAPVGPAAAAGTNGIVIPKPLSPSIAPATRPAGPQNLYTYSSYFVTFDRDHEDWTTIIQTDDDVANQLTESAYSDRTTLRKLDRARLRQKQQPATRAATTREDARQFRPGLVEARRERASDDSGAEVCFGCGLSIRPAAGSLKGHRPAALLPAAGAGAIITAAFTAGSRAIHVRILCQQPAKRDEPVRRCGIRPRSGVGRANGSGGSDHRSHRGRWNLHHTLRHSSGRMARQHQRGLPVAGFPDR